MPAHGTAPDEVLQLVTRAGGSWWLAIASNQPTAEDDVVELADIPPLEIPRDDTAWDDPADGAVSHLTGVTMDPATAETSAGAWVLFDDEALTIPRWSRWLVLDDESQNVPEGTELVLPPEVLTIKFTPSTYPTV